jgi:hypothetical protein
MGEHRGGTVSCCDAVAEFGRAPSVGRSDRRTVIASPRASAVKSWNGTGRGVTPNSYNRDAQTAGGCGANPEEVRNKGW